MATFVLIHGSMHGAWCWDGLAAALENRGHSVIAPELPCDDVTAGIPEYADVACAAIGSASTIAPNTEVTLVGHSLGSRTIPVVAERLPGCRMAFLCSAPLPLGPVDPLDFAGMVTREYSEAPLEERSDGARRIELAFARELFFHDCEEALAAWATDRLRWQGPKPLLEPLPLTRWPDRKTQIIVAQHDRVANPDWLMNVARAEHPYATLATIPGGHSPMLSRPEELANLLLAD